MKDHLFKSERLGFRPWRIDDVDDYYQLSSDPAVMKYFPSVLTRKDCSQFIERMIEIQEQYDYSYYRVHLLDSGTFVGFIGTAYQTYESPITPCTDIGWRLIPSAWGLGLATEGARVCLDRAFRIHGLPAVYSMAAAPNEPSFRVMKKLGMRAVTSFDHPYLRGCEHLQPITAFVLSAEDYASASS